MRMQHLPIAAAITVTFMLFAVLLNSVGPAILQSILTFGVSKGEASILEGGKDISCALMSLFVAAFLQNLGYRRGTALGLIGVAIASALVPLVGQFWILALQFIVAGAAFAIAKSSVYVIVGLITTTPKEHASTTSTIEGLFMIGVLSSFWLFSAFIDRAHPASLHWLNVYWWLAGACVLAAAIIVVAPLDERLARADDCGILPTLLAMPRLVAFPFVGTFLVCAFLDVLVEQSFGSWLPTFNREVLGLSPTLAVQLASLYATSLAVGRLGAGIILRRVAWVWVLGVGLALAMLLLAIVVPMVQPTGIGALASWRDLPSAAYLVPAVGLVLAPIYPVLCSSVLSALTPARHAPMTGLILLFSALGGTLGSLITGKLFAALNGKTAFLAVLPSMAGLLIAIILFDRTLRRSNLRVGEAISGEPLGGSG